MKQVLLAITLSLISGPAQCDKGFRAAVTPRRAAVQQTVFAGTLSGHDRRPMPKAHVHLARFNQSKPLASVEAGQDGGFKLATAETGLFQLLFTGANHQPHELLLLVDRPTQVALDIRLRTYGYKDDFNEVKIIGDFNDFNFKSARAMVRQPDGIFVAEFETTAGRFTYQLLGLTKGGGSVNGTQSEDYVYDGGGDYRSVVTPQNGHVRIVFDPKALVRSDVPAQVSFRDAKSSAARFASLYAAMSGRRARLHRALVEYKQTGRPLNQFTYDWSPDLADLARKISAERDPLLRQALLLSYLDIGYGTFGATLDAELARKALAEIAPTSPLWAVEPTLMGIAIHYAGPPERYTAYVQQAINTHPDPAVVRIVKANLAPDRHIMIGKMVPPFSLASLDSPGLAYTSESLKGKAVMIDFWATWCVPCIEEMPNLHQAYEKFKRQGFEILSVSLDEQPEVVREFRKAKWKMPWLHALLSSSAEAKKQFEIVGIPKAVLIDGDVHIIAADRELRGPNLDRTLVRVLNAPK